ncbi:hypothetical protein DL96DRAFT_1735045 [Flagelloscypha sp. PMI_526]|nr:hypothetical protein DL96DRAFT_1735045 [Flagelloscypha sp. PMI_526]
MASLESFPYDIMLVVVSKCEASALAAICRTSRSLLESAQKCLYHRVYLDTKDIELFLQARGYFHLIQHFSLIGTIPNERPGGPWSTLFRIIPQQCRLLSFRLHGGIASPNNTIHGLVEPILSIDTLQYVTVSTHHISPRTAARCPILKEFAVERPAYYQHNIPPTPDSLRATLYSLSLSHSVPLESLQSHFNLHRLRRLAFYRFGANERKVHMIDLLKETSPTLQELSLWLNKVNDFQFLFQDVEFPALRVLILSDSVLYACRFKTHFVPILDMVLQQAPMLEELRFNCEWMNPGTMAPDLLSHIPTLPKFNAQIKRLTFHFSEEWTFFTSLEDEEKVKVVIREKWGEEQVIGINFRREFVVFFAFFRCLPTSMSMIQSSCLSAVDSR